MPRPRFPDEILGEPGVPHPAASRLRAVLDPVLRVLARGAPREPVRPVVELVAVKVTRLMAVWPWTVERFQDKIMHVARCPPVRSREVNHQVAGSATVRGQQVTAMAAASCVRSLAAIDAAVVTHRVQPLLAHDGQPVLHPW